MKRDIEREKVYDFIKDMEELCIKMNDLPDRHREMYFEGVKSVLTRLWTSDIIRSSDYMKIDEIIGQGK